ncbi:DGQHR domain-containing protein DpdB [Phenylobacterium sp.]|uniref:DGQHR domain-containing protein DpdB n=1 Tax=Phenylobacterium sp. TaxID=1871053 RepID=UPI00356A9E6E
MSSLTFFATRARQSVEHEVLTFAATAEQVLSFAQIDRIGRDAQGELQGFQRPQIAHHIREIRDYLEKPDAVLPNAIVIAFTEGVVFKETQPGICKVTIDITDGPRGLVVDGQQRLSALSQVNRPDFQLFVSLLICRDDMELRRQFVLINNTRPLPKSLIYELLPTVDGLPDRMESRSTAATLTERLNRSESSSLKGQISQHTNPDGAIKDTVFQRAMMTSLSDGVLRELIDLPGGEAKCVKLVSEFFKAVQNTFPEEWWGQTASSSRLLGGAGIQSMAYVMDDLAHGGARTWREFAEGLECLKGKTAWTAGSWDFGGGDVRHWHAINVVNRDVVMITNYLQTLVRRDQRARRSGDPAPAPLMERLLSPNDS